MLDREFEKLLQSSEGIVLKKDKNIFLWLVTAFVIIMPSIIYLYKI